MYIKESYNEGINLKAVSKQPSKAMQDEKEK